MWLDSEGVAHTVAVADPGWAFEPELLVAVASAGEQERQDLRAVLDELMGELFEELEAAQIETDHLVEVPIAQGLFGQGVAADDYPGLVNRVRAAAADLPFEFRLDGLLALEDLLDSLDE